MRVNAPLKGNWSPIRWCSLALLLVGAGVAWADDVPWLDAVAGPEFTLGSGTEAAPGEVVSGEPLTPVLSGRSPARAGAVKTALGPVPLTILIQPSLEQPVPINGFFFLSVEATGIGPLSYQWQLNGVSLPNETNSTFFRANFTLMEAGAYRVVVTDSERSVISEAASVQAQVDQLPFSDNFNASPAEPGPRFITGLRGAGAGGNLTATPELGEPDHAGLPPGASVWVAWRPDIHGVATLNTEGSDFDTVAAVYTVAPGQIPTLASLVPIAADDDQLIPPASHLQFNVIPGQTYYLALDGVQSRDRGGRGRIALTWNVEATPHSVPIIIRQPAPLTSEPGQPGGFQIQFVPDPTAVRTTVQWFRGGVLIPGATDLLLNFDFITETDVWPYYAEITQFYPDGSSRVTLTEVVDIQLSLQSDGKPAGIRAYDKLSRLWADIPLGGGAVVAARASRPRLHGLARGVSGTQVFSTVGATRDEGEPIHCDVPGGASQWYAIIADADGVIEVDTKGSVSAAGGSLDTVLAVYFDEGTGEGIYDGLQSVACNNDVSLDDRSSAVAFCARKGTIYVIAVDGVGGAVGRVKLNFRMIEGDPQGLCSAPQVLCPPVPEQSVVTAGGSITLSCQVSAPPPLSYQWSRDGSPILGATNANLRLQKVLAGQAGVYSVTVANDLGVDFRVVSAIKVNDSAEPVLGYHRLCDGGLRLLLAAPAKSTVVLESTTDFKTWAPVRTNTVGVEPSEFLLGPSALPDSLGFRARTQ